MWEFFANRSFLARLSSRLVILAFVASLAALESCLHSFLLQTKFRAKMSKRVLPDPDACEGNLI